MVKELDKAREDRSAKIASALYREGENPQRAKGKPVKGEEPEATRVRLQSSECCQAPWPT